MSDLTDNYILPPNEYGCVDAGTTKIIFSDKAHFDFDGYINKQNWAQKIRTHTLKSRRTQNESVFVADFGPEA